MAELRRWVCDICKSAIEQETRQPILVPVQPVGTPPLTIDLCFGCALNEHNTLLETFEQVGFENPRALIQVAFTGLGNCEPVFDFLQRTGKLKIDESESGGSETEQQEATPAAEVPQTIGENHGKRRRSVSGVAARQPAEQRNGRGGEQPAGDERGAVQRRDAQPSDVDHP